MTEPVVLRETDARGVVTITLNRPEVNNAYDGAMIEALIGHVDAATADPAARVLVLRGNGRHFQAGADLNWINAVRARPEADNVAVSRRTAQAVRRLNELALPTVALVHGGCFGGGVGVVAACDVVIAEECAVFSISEARWGLIASIIVPQLNGAMGVRQVRRYALTCERFSAERARELGLVHEVCPPGGLEAAAAPVIEGLLKSAPGAVAMTKRSALEQARLTMSEEYLDTLVREHAAQRMGDEGGEGLASFAGKRDPAWYPG